MRRLADYLKQAVSSWNVMPRRASVEDTAVGRQDETLTGRMSAADAYLDRIPVIDVREVRIGGVRVDVDRRKVDEPEFLWRETRDSFDVAPKNAKLELKVEKGYVSRFAGEWTLREHAEMSLIGSGDDLMRSINAYTRNYIIGDTGGNSAVEETRAVLKHVDRILDGSDTSTRLNDNARRSAETLRAVILAKINYLEGESNDEFNVYLTRSLADKRFNDMQRVKKRVRGMDEIVEGKRYNFNSKDKSGDVFDRLTVRCSNVNGRIGYNVDFNDSNGMSMDSSGKNRIYWSVLDDVLGSENEFTNSRKLVSGAIKRRLNRTGYYDKQVA